MRQKFLPSGKDQVDKSDYISDEELFQYCTCELGVTPFDYYDLSPKELSLIADYRSKKKKNDYEMLRKIIMIGVACALKGKDKPLFSESESKVSAISEEDRESTLKMIDDIFGGGE